VRSAVVCMTRLVTKCFRRSRASFGSSFLNPCAKTHPCSASSGRGGLQPLRCASHMYVVRLPRACAQRVHTQGGVQAGAQIRDGLRYFD
jgi:hypothetical protein